MTDDINPFETPQAADQAVAKETWVILRPGVWQNELAHLITGVIAAVDLVIFQGGVSFLLIAVVYFVSPIFAAYLGGKDCAADGHLIRSILLVIFALISLPIAYVMMAMTCSSALSSLDLIGHLSVRADTFSQKMLASLVVFTTVSGPGLIVFFAVYGFMRAYSISWKPR